MTPVEAYSLALASLPLVQQSANSPQTRDSLACREREMVEQLPPIDGAKSFVLANELEVGLGAAIGKHGTGHPTERDLRSAHLHLRDRILAPYYNTLIPDAERQIVRAWLSHLHALPTEHTAATLRSAVARGAILRGSGTGTVYVVGLAPEQFEECRQAFPIHVDAPGAETFERGFVRNPNWKDIEPFSLPPDELLELRRRLADAPRVLRPRTLLDDSLHLFD